jgi:hypothetical protein
MKKGFTGGTELDDIQFHLDGTCMNGFKIYKTSDRNEEGAGIGKKRYFDPDDCGNSWQSMYGLMRCSIP